jgi:hypothetical protein
MLLVAPARHALQATLTLPGGNSVGIAAIKTNTGITLTRLFDECDPADSLAPHHAGIREWATSYLVAPHPALGREGPVCPFTSASINKKTFWVGCLDRSDLTADDIEKTVADAVQVFRLLPPTEGPETLLKTILILFPTVADYSLIDEAQKKLKEESVPMGLMIGQFYPGCEEPGIRNRNFRPLQSPLPLLAIRNMVGSDFPFLAARGEWVQDYLNKFAPAIPEPVRSVIAGKFDELA